MIRWLFLAHRYLGIAVGIVMALWCLSGIVMMYVQYPELSERQKLAGLAPLDLDGCCRLPDDALTAEIPVARFRVEMLADRPVLRVEPGFGPQDTVMYDLREGQLVGLPDAALIHAAADAWRARRRLDPPMRYLGGLYNDQWTVYAAYDRHRPLHRFAAGDAAGTEWYVSGSTGEVVQETTRRQRFWNWLGAVVHWLYPTQLRQHTAVWAQVVIWLTVLGIFLTAIGLYIGVKQFRSRPNGRNSPYRGASLWHHYSGLVFGILVLSWVVSGLFSMNPWGLLESEGASAERARLHGSGLEPRAVGDFVARLGVNGIEGDVVRLEGYTLGGTFGVLAHDRDGGTRRLDERLRPAPLAPVDWAAMPDRLRPGTPVREAVWQTGEDAYYYDHHETLDYPVYRIVFDDGERTRYYLDGVSGELSLKVDAERRWYRWLHYGLHRGDFTGLLRSRPVWDVFMLMLMAGVTVSCATGAWMGVRRLRRNARQRQRRSALA